jgi:sugar phosphate permease
MKEWLGKLFLASMAALAPIKMVMITVGFLILADLVTGMWAAHKRGEKISSAAMRRTISKIFIYQLTVVSGFMLETYILDKMLPVAKIVAGVIGMVEFKSILENSNHIVGGDIFKLVIQKLGSENDSKKKE